MKHFNSLNDLHQAVGIAPPRHPLVSIYSFESPKSLTNSLGEFTSDFYWIAFKKIRSGVFLYGRTQYDHQSGSMYFAKPDQIIETKSVEYEVKGFVIIIHKDFFSGRVQMDQLQKYSFFDYEMNEALHLSGEEEQTIWDIYDKIAEEYNTNQDEFSYKIIWSHIHTILQYAQRFYKQQMINRSLVLGKQITRFNQILAEYIHENGLSETGLPTVKFMAGKMNISAGYLSDLLKQETGKTAIELIHLYLIQYAKELLMRSELNISEIAFKSGFENLPYFSRLFKKEAGLTPTAFRKKYLQ